MLVIKYNSRLNSSVKFEIENTSLYFLKERILSIIIKHFIKQNKLSTMGKKPGATVEMNATAVSIPNPLANSTPRDIEGNPLATVASVAVIANKIRRPSAVTYLDNKERVEGYVKCLKYSNFILLFL